MEPLLTRRSTLTLFLLIFLVTGLAATLYLVRQRQELREKAVVVTAIYFSPDSVTTDIGGQVLLDVMIDAGDPASDGDLVTAVDLTISFDQELVEAESLILPPNNPFLPNLSLVVIDNDTGRISARFESLSPEDPPATGLGILAVVQFRGRNSGEALIDIEDETYVTALNQDGNVLNSRGQAKIVVFGTTPSPTPTPTPLPTPSPIPTPSPSPTPGPSVSPSPDVSPSTILDPCQNNQPATPTNLSASAVSTTQILLTWTPQGNVSYYGIVYGTSSGWYTWGAANVGNVSSFTVGSLSTGTTYYFALFSVNDCGTSGYSEEVWATTQSPGIGGAPIADPSPSPFASTSPEEEVEFIAIEPGAPPEEVIPFLAAKLKPTPTPEVPTVSIPPEYFKEKGKVPNELLTRLGGVFLIIVSVFVGIFFLRMKHS